MALKTFPIAAIAATAERADAVGELTGLLGSTPGMSVIVMSSDGARDDSVLAQVAARSSLPVVEVLDGMRVEADHIYVPRDGEAIGIRDGALYVATNSPASRVDLLFCTLAEDQGARAIAVMLSGSSATAIRGSRAVKAEGGICLGESMNGEEDATARGALAAGLLDAVLPVPAIARELLRLAQHLHVARPDETVSEKDMTQLFALLKTAYVVDFTHYKSTTVERRVRRRMTLHKVDTIEAYLDVVRRDAAEVHRLYADILIHVTSFFRDPEVFEALQNEVLPRLLTPDRTTPVRIWVPGCATGEEVYSLAIVVLEFAASRNFPPMFQIFGSDISDPVVDYARSGEYPVTIASEVSPERLSRFFVKTDSGYRVSRAVRDCCVFARQNLLKDPPFSRLDLVSCRNLLIYLDNELQQKVMSTFHYALRPDGLLLLGSSETIGAHGELFAPLDRKHKIYEKRPAAVPPRVEFEAPAPLREIVERKRMDEEQSAPNIFREADRVLLTRYAPPGVLINENMDIVQFRGRTSLFLEPAPGAASFNVLKMAREGLLGELRTAILASKKSGTPVRRENIRLSSNGDARLVAVEVIPFAGGSKERYQMIVFEEMAEPSPGVEEKAKRSGKEKKTDAATETRESLRLRRELEATREYLQSIIEEQEAMNEELRSANEEIQSSNEELQSTNEELETAKEELQSSNEELTTLNEELENRNEELAEANNDLVNLLASVDIPIVMLDNSMRVRRFNPGAQRALNLVAADVSRPIGDLKLTLQLEDLDKLTAMVIDTLETRELEVKDRNGRRYMLRIRPYKTMDNKIEGAVLVLIDMDQLAKKV
jgi:two-component system CheB/CheR fusion protein